MLKFEAKKGDFAKIWQILGGYSSPSPPGLPLMSKASTSTGIPYATLLYAKRNSRNQVRSNGKECH